MFDFDKSDEDTRMEMIELHSDTAPIEKLRDVKVQSSRACLPARRFS
jgi:hypothetical protein